MGRSRGVYLRRDMWRSVLLELGLAGMLAGCSVGDGGHQAAVSGRVASPSGSEVAKMVDQLPLRVMPGTFSQVHCAVDGHAAHCTGVLAPPVGARLALRESIVLRMGFRLRQRGSLWRAVPKCDTPFNDNPYCPA